MKVKSSLVKPVRAWPLLIDWVDKPASLKTCRRSSPGMALISVLAITSIVLLIISTTVLSSITNARIGLDYHRSQQGYQAVQSLAEEAILCFLRRREAMVNPYPDWTEDCLQIRNWQCKMETSLTEAGGEIEVWGKMSNKLRHLKLVLSVDDQGQVRVVSREEVY